MAPSAGEIVIKSCVSASLASTSVTCSREGCVAVALLLTGGRSPHCTDGSAQCTGCFSLIHF